MRFQPVERGCTRLSPPCARLECQPHLLGPRRYLAALIFSGDWAWSILSARAPSPRCISRCRGRCAHVLRSRTKIEAQIIAPLEALKELGDSDVAIETAALLETNSAGCSNVHTYYITRDREDEEHEADEECDDKELDVELLHE